MQQAKTGEKVGHRSKFGRFKADTKKTQGSNHRGTTTMKHRDVGPRPRKKTPYELRDQELKAEESELAKRKLWTGKAAAAKTQEEYWSDQREDNLEEETSKEIQK